MLLGDSHARPVRFAEVSTRLNDFFGEALPVVRAQFRGKVTYACIQFEQVDWTPFDYLSIELIRSAEVADRFREGVRTLVAQGKPLAVTGFGTATWHGSGRRERKSCSSPASS